MVFKILNDLSEFSAEKTIITSTSAQNSLKIWSIPFCHSHERMCLLSAKLKQK